MRETALPARPVRLAVALGLSTCLAAPACVTVPPTQRGLLVAPEMDPGTTRLEGTFHSHVESAREGAFGGHGSQGGGCGCG